MEEPQAHPAEPTPEVTEPDRSEPPLPEAELAKLELAIKATEAQGALAKAEASVNFGQYLLTLKKNKQLPAGVLDRHAKAHNVSRSTLADRRRLAEVYPTREALEAKLAELSTRVESRRLWTALKNTLYKTRTPRAPKTPRTSQQSAFVPCRDELDARLDSGDGITPEEAVVLSAIAQKIARIQGTVAMLKAS
jgi:hypothetical protein